MDPVLWAECDRNPIAFLDALSVERLKELEKGTRFSSPCSMPCMRSSATT
ncbi:MAG: DUF3417 domain-containing protein [Alistipes finegoldii]